MGAGRQAGRQSDCYVPEPKLAWYPDEGSQSSTTSLPGMESASLVESSSVETMKLSNCRQRRNQDKNIKRAVI